jgi:acyl-[acyl-carrier-protein]-phospholipid O-acyltransferase/long-chain-fatty-acid--[acyl-carrier-protein] ligase
VIVGAEKLKSRVAAAFQERFGILPLEGYGATELSPIAGVNVPNVNLGGTAQEGYRLGSIGRPIPGVTMKIVAPDDLDRELPQGDDGLLLVKGPNVMKGYLGRPEETAAVMHDGWYVTGDVARIDHDGFVTITDRLSRFSKIGGEMVPHLVVEESLHAGLNLESQVFAVTSLPDEKKGERLVVLYTPEAGNPHEAHSRLRESGLPNLWIPSPEDFLAVESIPLLGSGKIDLKGLKTLAQKLVSN